MLSIKLHHFPFRVFLRGANRASTAWRFNLSDAADEPPITIARSFRVAVCEVVSKPVKGRSTPAQT
jgi:hypothetical protein